MSEFTPIMSVADVIAGIVSHAAVLPDHQDASREAFWLCHECGAVVMDKRTHDWWHASLDRMTYQTEED